MNLETELNKMGACREAVKWVGKRTFEQAWAECERPDWMLWYAARKNVDRKLIVFAGCQCARTVLKIVPENEKRPAIAIETAEKWVRGEATLEEVRAAEAAAWAAAWAATASAATASAAAKAEQKKMANKIRKIIKF